jgi:hypothetical protein
LAKELLKEKSKGNSRWILPISVFLIFARSHERAIIKLVDNLPQLRRTEFAEAINHYPGASDS